MGHSRGLTKIAFIGKALKIAGTGLTGLGVATADHSKGIAQKASKMFGKVKPIKAAPVPKPTINMHRPKIV